MEQKIQAKNDNFLFELVKIIALWNEIDRINRQYMYELLTGHRGSVSSILNEVSVISIGNYQSSQQLLKILSGSIVHDHNICLV